MAHWTTMLRGIVVVFAVLALAVPVAQSAPSAEQGKASVRIVQLSPLVVAGERFRSLQRIKITVRAPSGTYSKTARTTVRGTFVARFTAVTGHRCDGGVSVVVTTASGMTAIAKTKTPDPLCPPSGRSPAA